MPRLRRTQCSGPGLARRRVGRGFTYVDACGQRVEDPQVRARIEALVIPPAWRDVWICPWPNGHIQAVGTDAAGRRQYRYHDEWRKRRDRAKHERVLQVARRLPAARARFSRDLALPGLQRARVLAAAARLLDLGFFRIGSEQYAEDNGAYGLATLQRQHVHIKDDRIVFDYIAKSGKHRVQSVVDADVLDVVQTLRHRRGGPADLLVYRDDDGWHDVDADDVNAYLRETLGSDGGVTVSAKDFRTWHATVLMAVALGVSTRPESPSARTKVIARAYREVAHYLGNTPAVCRASYVDPRIVDLWHDGATVRGALDELGEGGHVGQPATQGAVEAAVLELLDGSVAAEHAA